MNLATGTLMLFGLTLFLTGVASKFMGASLLAPFIKSYMGYFIAANSCIILALAIEKFQKQ